MCTTDPNAGDEGVALIYVPKDTPGLTFGEPEKKMLFKKAINRGSHGLYKDDSTLWTGLF